ncbi:four helix bundle protein [Flavobacterium sp.]|jgi:four helix bundle protein|uniref:four helix bundle protein n=1 Tax=Flavobacterium sp. TaxID=239 RepID=UPI0037C168D2
MKEIMKNRTKKFALDCWILCSKLPKSREFNAYVSQLIRCSSSVGANYRALQRAKSNADFINKLKIIEEEADESHFFLELLYEVSSLQNLKLDNEFIPLTQEANEITAIIVSTLKTVRNKS